MDVSIKSEIIEQIKSIIALLAPYSDMREMYGGTVIETIGGNPKTRIGGFYVYNDYVSVEFKNGYLFEDPNKLLEGAGKKRRHLKLRLTEDIKTKKLNDFIGQALKVI